MVEFQAGSPIESASIVCVPRYFFTILSEMIYHEFSIRVSLCLHGAAKN